jgi:hypothetical protein
VQISAVHARSVWIVNFFAVLFVIPVYPQEANCPSKGRKPVFQGVICQHRRNGKVLGHVDDGNNGSSVRTDYHHMLVEKQPGVTDELPEQFGEYHVEYPDTPEETARCKVLRKDF